MRDGPGEHVKKYLHRSGWLGKVLRETGLFWSWETGASSLAQCAHCVPSCHKGWTGAAVWGLLKREVATWRDEQDTNKNVRVSNGSETKKPQKRKYWINSCENEPKKQSQLWFYIFSSSLSVCFLPATTFEATFQFWTHFIAGTKTGFITSLGTDAKSSEDSK